MLNGHVMYHCLNHSHWFHAGWTFYKILEVHKIHFIFFFSLVFVKYFCLVLVPNLGLKSANGATMINKGKHIKCFWKKWKYNQNTRKHYKTVCIFDGIYCSHAALCRVSAEYMDCWPNLHWSHPGQLPNGKQLQQLVHAVMSYVMTGVQHNCLVNKYRSYNIWLGHGVAAILSPGIAISW